MTELTANAKTGLNADYVRIQIGRSQTRSMTIAARGIVAAESSLAAQAGAVVLARGGHAVDAAIAANAVMGVVAPMMNGIGGDLFAIVHDARTGALHGLNASGWSPAALTIEFLAARGSISMRQRGIHSVTVPGAVSGWMALHERFGRVPFDVVLSAAIAHAEEGFPVAEITALEWAGAIPLLRTDTNAIRTFCVMERRRPSLASDFEIRISLGRSGALRVLAARRSIAARWRSEFSAAAPNTAACTPRRPLRVQAGMGHAADDQLPRLGRL